jgi:hypothetical protein
MAKTTRKQRHSKRPVKTTSKSAAKATHVSAAKTQPVTELSSGFRLLSSSVKSLATHWPFWLKFVLLFGALNLILANSFSIDVPSLKNELATYFGAQSAVTGIGTYALLVTSSGSTTSGAASVYQFLLILIASLAAIWALRQYRTDAAVSSLSLRDSLYKSMHPFVPFVLVLLVVALTLLPMLLSASLYSAVLSGGVTRTGLEQFVFLMIFLIGVAVTVWLLTRWLFGIYIVTLEDMRPVRALKESVKLVRGHQLAVIRKVLFLLVALVVISMVVLVPVIMFATPLALPLFFVLGLVALPLTHSYLYELYRELLG